MKLYELLTESKAKKIDEAPMGMFKTLGNKAMAKMGNARAGGKVGTGSLANQLHKEFQHYLGSSGEDATKRSILAFLKSKKYPTQAAATAINQAGKAAVAPAGPVPGARAAPADRIEPTMAAKPAAGGSTYDTSTAPDRAAKGQADQAAAGVQMDATKKANAAAAADDAAMRAAAQAAADKPGFQQTPADRAALKAAAAKGFKPKVAVSAGKINTGRAIKEAGAGVLPQAIVDQAFMAAAQEAIRIDPTRAGAPAGASGTTTGPVAGSKSAGGSFTAGLKKGFTGKPAAPATAPDVSGLEQRIAAIEKKVGLS